MIKILVPGDDKRLMRYKKFECTRCGCIFVASSDDYDNISNQHDGIIYRSSCTHCGATLYNYSEKYCTEDGEEL